MRLTHIFRNLVEANGVYVYMSRYFPLSMIGLAIVICFPQSLLHLKSDSVPKWQKVDQLCGMLQLVMPTKETFLVYGKKESRLYATTVPDAEVTLYRGDVSDKGCCGDRALLARTRSKRHGTFEFEGFPRGLYWLRATKGRSNWTIPLRVTDNFDGKSCHAPEVGRSFILDAQPPKVITRIY